MGTLRWQETSEVLAWTGAGEAGVLRFGVEPLRRHMLLHGLDAVGVTLGHAEDIRRFERQHLEREPWMG